ncbi:MAG: TonB family protein [Pyrinomonadaceae bacterium]
MKKFFLIFVVLFLNSSATTIVYSQSSESSDWSSFESDEKDFSITLPDNYQVFSNKEGYSFTTFEDFNRGKLKNNINLKNIQYITAAKDGATFFVISYQTNNLDNAFSYVSAFSFEDEKVFSFTKNEFKVKTVTSYKDKYYLQHIYLAYKDHIYHVFGGSRDEKNPALVRFLTSLKIKNEFFFKEPAPSVIEAKETVSISGLTDTPFVVENEPKDSSKSVTKVSDDFSSKESDDFLPLTIIYKMIPKYTDSARRKNTKGEVRLRITFSADANIERISVIEGLPNGLTESAILAGRLMRFLPAEKNKVPISMTKVVIFTFTIF